MPRPPRVDASDVVHHVVNRGVDRQRIFFDDRDRVRFGQLLGEAHQRFAISVLSYCLMDNHFHLMVHCPTPVLSESMQFIGSAYANHVNRAHGRVGHLFGARFWSAPLDTDRYKLNSLRYIERNSLAIAGVESPEAYRWSSVRSHLGYRRSSDWLDSDAVRSWFSTIETYRQFVAQAPRTIEPARIDLASCGRIISLMINTHIAPDLATTRMTRTVAVGLSQSLEPANERRMLDSLGLTSARSVREAVQRYERRSSEAPSIITAVEAARCWLIDQRTTVGRTAA